MDSDEKISHSGANFAVSFFIFVWECLMLCCVGVHGANCPTYQQYAKIICVASAVVASAVVASVVRGVLSHPCSLLSLFFLSLFLFHIF